MAAGAAILKRGRGPVLRCPACGHRFEQPAPSRCELCAFEIDGGRATGADLTPYAQAYARGEGAWFRMLEWVWFAGSERIRHAALLRSSAASRRFAQINCTLLALAVTLVQLTNSPLGWHWCGASAEPDRARGWVKLAAAPRALVGSAESAAALWWSVPQAALIAALSMVTALFVIWLTLAVVSGLIDLAHLPHYRGEYRMTAAMHYSTAWVIPIVAGALIAGASPLAYAGEVARWTWAPSTMTLRITAGAVAGLGVCMWWFWLTRVATAAPVRTRTRVTVFFAIGLPLVAAAAATGWHFGLTALSELLVELFEMGFA
ncbi:MAG: hypothetical protein C4547_11550 [Phycisphaerales bacterium]|nr:MAG: hypothetical protein C4547_11550 [Phycisphaerales bacterium]